MKQRKIVIMDGQGGKIGALLTEQLKAQGCADSIYAIGTNAVATAAMLRAGADFGATGENPARVNCRDADIIAGPVGIVVADALLGEVTPAMAAAVGGSAARKILLPVNRCETIVVGVPELPLAELVRLALREIMGG